MKTINLQENSPLLFAENNIGFSATGSILIAYTINYSEIYSLGDRNFDAIHSVWQKAFKNLPSGTMIHKQDLYLKEKYRGNLPKTTDQAIFLGSVCLCKQFG